MLCTLVIVHFSENLSKMGFSRLCSGELHILIKMLIEVGKTHTEVNKMI